MKTPFTLEQISRAHEGVSQDTVRAYLARLLALGVVSYTTHISDGHSDYVDGSGNMLSSAAVHDAFEVSGNANREDARLALDAHSRRETGYLTFSRQLADAGVATWVMDPVNMTCTFYSKSGEPLIVEDV